MEMLKVPLLGGVQGWVQREDSNPLPFSEFDAQVDFGSPSGNPVNPVPAVKSPSASLPLIHFSFAPLRYSVGNP